MFQDLLSWRKNWACQQRCPKWAWWTVSLGRSGRCLSRNLTHLPLVWSTFHNWPFSALRRLGHVGGRSNETRTSSAQQPRGSDGGWCSTVVLGSAVVDKVEGVLGSKGSVHMVCDFPTTMTRTGWIQREPFLWRQKKNAEGSVVVFKFARNGIYVSL